MDVGVVGTIGGMLAAVFSISAGFAFGKLQDKRGRLLETLRTELAELEMVVNLACQSYTHEFLEIFLTKLLQYINQTKQT